MILDGTMPYQVFDMTRFVGMTLAFALTIVVEAGLIIYIKEKYNVQSKFDWFMLIVIGNLLTFLLGMLLFVGGV